MTRNAADSAAKLDERIRAQARSTRLPDGRELPVLGFYDAKDLARSLPRGAQRGAHGQPGRPRGRALAQVERAALALGVWPERYLRNFDAYSAAEQLRLAESRAVLIGLGGLGGHVLELLARAGVGAVRAADGDEFEPSNLNRQLYATRRSMGGYKAAAAAARLGLVNPAVAFEPVADFVGEAGMAALSADAQVCLDALGGLAGRAELARAADRAGIPLVMAAVSGQSGLVATVLPGGKSPAEFFGTGAGAEDSQGTPAPAVAVAASLMAGEALNILCGRSAALAGKLLAFDLAEMRFETFSL